MSSAVQEKLSNFVKLLSAPIPGSYFLIMRKNVVSGVYITDNCKGTVIFLMTEKRANARFRFYQTGLRQVVSICFLSFSFYAPGLILFDLYVVSAAITQRCQQAVNTEKFYREDKMPIREKDTSGLTDLVRRACRRSVQKAGKHDCLKDCSHYLKRLPWLTSSHNETCKSQN